MVTSSIQSSLPASLVMDLKWDLLQFECLESLSDITAQAWDGLMRQDNPFCRYDFLAALEFSGSACSASGWAPRHLCVYYPQPLSTHSDERMLLAVMPLYSKSHSYGEYVFDWAWAEAYERHGVDYYPKLVNSIPFTPVSGTRIGLCTWLTTSQQQQLVRHVLAQLTLWLSEQQFSSWHCLFVLPQQQTLFTHQGAFSRLGTQFHWYNRGYQSFEDFLSTLTSRKRKTILKERALVTASGLSCRFVEGGALTAQQWQMFVQCYQRTYLKRSGHLGYLTPSFFSQVAASMTTNIVMLVVENDSGEMVAGALYFKSQHTLYGRYWGSMIEVDGLHFEACYYQGIAYCIEHQLAVFDAGAQGEHKVLRGFEPIEIQSYHYVTHLGFREAIVDYCQQERQQMERYMQQMRTALPYKSKCD